MKRITYPGYSSITDLHASIFFLNSGSTDKTLNIYKEGNVVVKSDRFKSHPKQWDVALTVFNIETPSIIALNADQIAILELFYQLKSFRNEDYA